MLYIKKNLLKICSCSLGKFGASQDQDSLLVKRRNDSHSPGPVFLYIFFYHCSTMLKVNFNDVLLYTSDQKI